MVGIEGDVDIVVADRLRAVLAPTFGAGRDAILDLAGTGNIDSVGLGALVRAQCEAKKAGTVVALVAPSRFILTVMHTMHLARVFPMFHDVSAALAWRRSSHGTAMTSYRAGTVTVDP